MPPALHRGSATARLIGGSAAAPGGLDLVGNDFVGHPDGLEPRGGDLPQAPCSEAGEWLPRDGSFAQAHEAANGADLVLQEIAKGLDEIHVVLRSADAALAREGSSARFAANDPAASRILDSGSVIC